MNSAASGSVSATTPEEFKRMLAHAIDLKNQELYGEAAQVLEQLRRTNPQSAAVHALQGYSLWEGNDLAGAIPCFRRAVELSPQSEMASLGLFHTLMESHDKQGAVAEMNRFLSVADSVEYNQIARSLAHEGPASEAHEETI